MYLKYTVKRNNCTAKDFHCHTIGYSEYHTWQHERPYCRRSEYRPTRCNNYFRRDACAVREMTFRRQMRMISVTSEKHTEFSVAPITTITSRHVASLRDTQTNNRTRRYVKRQRRLAIITDENRFQTATWCFMSAFQLFDTKLSVIDI